ncbi:hypothetical protein [Mucilaginibacter gynuensis]|uniref:hypothetical protein n=1 Tax=Mucilaginibacter gynuensis TaxID=1302236 RepID=UPI0031F023D5
MKILLKFASLVSWMGHPLFTSALMITLISLKRYQFKEACVIVAILVFGVIVPANLYTFLKVRKGSFRDFDVSNGKERLYFYVAIIILMSMGTGMLLYYLPNTAIASGSVLTVLLFITAFFINRFIKVSLHVSLTIYFSFIIGQFYPDLYLVLFVLTMLIAWSRLFLKRHTSKEIMVGTLVGIIYATILNYIIK